MQIIDLTHVVDGTIPVYPGCEAPSLSPATTLETDGFRETLLHLFSHTGTHMDAPFHLLANGPSLDKLPVSQFLGKALVVDCTCIPKGGRIPVEQLRPYHTMLEQAEFILFRTGWDRRFHQPDYFEGFPVPDASLLELLVASGIKGVGIDAISIDEVSTTTYPNHHILLEHGCIIVENLKNLDQIGTTCQFCALPLLYAQSDGAPVRAVAILEEAI